MTMTDGDLTVDTISVPLKFVDKKEHIHISRHKLPHWNQMGCVQFVTFRLADSLPQSKLREYKHLQEEWMMKHPKPRDNQIQAEYYQTIGRFVDKWLDAGRGSCLLGDKRPRDILEKAMMHFHGSRYRIHSYVIMPNHVHVLLSAWGENDVRSIVGSWKKYSARLINQLYRREGILWERECFDHMVRSPEAYEAKLRYIAQNPKYLFAGKFTLVTEV